MESNDELRKIDIKNNLCYYYINCNFDFDNTLLDKK